MHKSCWTVGEYPYLPVPSGVSRLFVTGLDTNSGYRVERRGGDMTVTPGGDKHTDGGGVLVIPM
jgi:hypothetical protein